MSDNKLYAKRERDVDLLIHLTRVFSNDIGMTFGLRKCGGLIVSRGRMKHTDGLETTERRYIAERCKYLGLHLAIMTMRSAAKQSLSTNTE